MDLVCFASKRLLMKQLTENDITDEYVKWLNELKVTKFLEIRFTKHRRSDVVSYITKRLDPSNRCLHLGVFDHNGDRLIGTVTFNEINPHHSSAAISFVIGHPDATGKGYGFEAVHASTNYMFQAQGLFKIWGGYYDGHTASEKIFIKNGYKIEGRLQEKLLDYRGKRVDHVLVGLLARDFLPNNDILSLNT